ncbi:competence protein CoiA family protein [Companilactobacillus sp. DQM5]|uniref:competence protein CoiA family protein n=1 Tax=Companilactobacillus sp. DQM5 TaxID=3463359 RepID=UPI004058215B
MHKIQSHNKSNETNIHRIGKNILKQDFEINGYITTSEIYIENNKQRIDVFAKKSTRKLALEFQNSPINKEILNDRIAGYNKGGYQSIWFLSQGYLTKLSNRQLKFLNYSTSWKWYLIFLNTNIHKYTLLFDINFVGPCLNIYYKKRNFNNLIEIIQFKELKQPFIHEKNINFIKIRQYCYEHNISYENKLNEIKMPPIFKHNLIQTLVEFEKFGVDKVVEIPAQIKINPQLVSKLQAEVNQKLNDLLFLIKRDIN